MSLLSTLKKISDAVFWVKKKAEDAKKKADEKSKKQVFRVGEGLTQETVARPGPTLFRASLPADEKVKLSLTEPEKISGKLNAEQRVKEGLKKEEETQKAIAKQKGPLSKENLKNVAEKASPVLDLLTKATRVGQAVSQPGGITKEIVKLASKNPKLAIDTAKAIVQAPQRALTSVALEPAAGILSLLKGKNIEPVYQPQGKLQQAILGKEPIKGIFKETADTQKIIEDYLQSKGMTSGVEKGVGLALAPLFIGGMKAMDLSPFGGNKKAIEKIAISKDAGIIFKELKTLFKGTADDALRVLSDKLVSITDKNVVSEILTDFTKEKPAVAKELSSLIPEVKLTPEQLQEKLNLAKDIYAKQKIKAPETKARIDYLEQQVNQADPLVQETRKYKSAEEFVKAQGTPVYRGDATPIKLSEMDTTKVFNPAEKEALGAFNNTPGLYFTDSVANAKSYGKNLTEVSVKPTANVINVSDAPKILKRADVEKIIRSNPRIKDWAMNWDENFDKAIKQITDSVMVEKDGNEFLKAIWSDGGFSEGDFVKAMQNAGIDGLKVPKEGVNHFVIYNKDAIQTKSQLTDIWNKANKTTGKLPQPAQRAIEEVVPPKMPKPETKLAPQPSVNPTAPPSISSKNVLDTSYKVGEDPIKVITQALKEAKPVRATQEAMYSAERSKRVARLISAGKSTPGEKGFFSQLGQLKGELPKAQFESVRSKISQPHIDELFNIVERNNFITPFEKLNAKSGLAKLLGADGGIVPTKGELELLSEIFPKEFVKEILDKRPFMTKLWGGVANALNLPRALMATADLSAPLRQGIFLIGKPKQWIPAFKEMFKYAFSEKAYLNLADEIRNRSTYLLMRENHLALTDMGENLVKREEQFMSNLGEKIPIFGRIAKGSNRAYSGFLNKLRADVFDDLYRKAVKLGVTKDNPKVVSDIAKFVNSATGRGDLGALNKAATVLNGAFFSPRLIASRINLLNPVYYVKLDPFVRKQALKSLFTFAGVGATTLGLAKLGGAEVGLDPRSADFGKIKIGNTRFDPWGGFQQYMVLISRLASGQMVSSTTGKEFTLGEGYKPTTRMDIIQRFFESKSSPVASFALGLLKGKTTMGEEFNLPVEITDRFIPMLMQDAYDLIREKGPAGIMWELPGMFGVGSQTYTDLIPLESKTATGKPTIKWRQHPGLGETLLNKLTGTKVEPVGVKTKYDEAQQLLKQGKKDEANAIVNSLSETDYALYKKFKERDTRIRHDEMKAKLIPLYNKNKKLLGEGKGLEAKMNISGLTDEEYKIYKAIKEEDYRTIQE